jgi:Reverse transcriptase (RNA-dependent DNA polymerase)./HNH endonuclease.
MGQVALPSIYKQGIWSALKAGVQVGYKVEDTAQGTPQGEVMSPLLANIALNGIEKLGKGIRYADDRVFIIQKGEAEEELKDKIILSLKERGLNIKESKTKLVSMANGFAFLGFKFKLIGKQGNKSKCYPNIDWLEELKRKTNHILKTSLSDADRIKKISRMCRGVAQYFKYCDLSEVQGQWYRLQEKLHKKLGTYKWRDRPLNYNSTGYVKVKGNKSPFDGDNAYWINRMNKKYDGLRRKLITSQDTQCPLCNLRLKVTDEIHVHHVNGNHSDNRRQNLQIVHRACPQMHHRTHGRKSPNIN